MAEINEFLSKNAIKQINLLNTELDKIITKYGKLGKVSIDLQKQKQAEVKTEESLIKQKQQLEKLNQQIAKTDAENLKAQQQLNKVLIDEEKIQQQKIKTEKDTLTLSEKKTKAAEKDRKEVEKQNSAYQKLNEKHKVAIKRAQDLAAQYGRFNKKAVQARREANKYDKELRKIDKSLGRNQRGVGSYFKSIVKFAGAMGLATGGVALFKKGLDIAKDSILSIQSTGDKFNNTLVGLKEGYNSFLRSAASGSSFKDLIQNFRDAVKVGTEYSAILDDLGDLQRSLKIAESETKLEQEKLLTISRNVNASDKERITAIDKYITLENKLVKDRKKNAEQTYAAELLIASQRSDLSQSEIEDFLKNQESYIDTVQKKAQAAAELDEQQKTIDLTTEEGRKQQIESLNELLGKQSEEEKQIEKIIKNAEQLDDAMRDRLVNAYKAVIDVETNSLKSSQRVLTMRNSLLKSLGDEDSTATQINNIDDIEKKTIESLDVKGESEDEFTKRHSDHLQKRYDENKAYLDKMKADEVSYYEIKNELINNYKDVAIETLNSIYDFQLNAIDNELDSLDSYYETKINAQSNLGESTIALESQYNLKRQALEDEREKKEKQQALINVGVSYAQSAFDITAQALQLTAAAALNPLLAPLIPFAWGQLGLLTLAKGVQTAAISAYDEGTTNSDSTFIAGEKAPEFGKINGQWQLIDKPTMFSNAAGSEIISSAETDQILKGASMKGNTGNTAIDSKNIIKAIKEIPQAPVMNDKGMMVRIGKNGSTEKWINSNIRRN